MSRSVHDTWAKLKEMARHRYEDRELRRQRLREVRENIHKKRRIKEGVLRDRTAAARPAEYVAPEAIRIEVRDRRPGIFYPASPEDLRGLMRRLPPDAYLGVRRIELCLGKERIRQHKLENEEEISPDPLTGRDGYEEFEGLYAPGILGTRFADGTIQLYAYVRTREIPHWAVVELFLRRQMLATFLHELAHHQDDMIRVARGRWRMDDEDKDESYARLQEQAWTREHLIPHLEAAHPQQIEELLRWVERHGGLRLPLSVLFTMDNDVLDGFHMFLREVLEGRELPESGVELAQYLLWNKHAASALELLEHLLALHPRNSRAHAIKAEVLLALERLEPAIASARAAIELEPGSSEGWKALLKGLEQRRDWPELLREAERARALVASREQGSLLEKRVLEKQVLALVNLCRYQDALELAEHLRSDTPGGVVGHVLRAVALLGCRREEEALEACKAAVDVGNDWTTRRWSAELEACRFVAAVRLGRFEQARAYLEREKDSRYAPARESYSELFESWVPSCLAQLESPPRPS